MKTCGMFNIAEFNVPMPRAADSFRLIPFGDVHRDSDLHAEDEWQAWLAYAAKQKNAFFIGMGDYLDGFSCSERAILSDGGIHETTRRRMERDTQGWIDTMARELRPIAPRIIGLLGGNHYAAFECGDSSDTRLANLLHTRFLGVMAAVRLNVIAGGGASKHSAAFGVDVAAHHGRGSARTVGGGLTGTQRLIDVVDADIYLMGDDHKAACSPVGQRLRLINIRGNLGMRARTPWVARTGSFTKGYEPGRPSYVVDAAYPPTTLGWVEFTVHVRQYGARDLRRREIVIDGATKCC